jgi:hypothetical protein
MMTDIKNGNKKMVAVAAREEGEAASQDSWDPTEEVFEDFLVRDYQLAGRNIRYLLRTYGESNFRELKETLLHSVDVVDRVLISQIASGVIIKTDNNRYRLA